MHPASCSNTTRGGGFILCLVLASPQPRFAQHHVQMFHRRHRSPAGPGHRKAASPPHAQERCAGSKRGHSWRRGSELRSALQKNDLRSTRFKNMQWGKHIFRLSLRLFSGFRLVAACTATAATCLWRRLIKIGCHRGEMGTLHLNSSWRGSSTRITDAVECFYNYSWFNAR